MSSRTATMDPNIEKKLGVPTAITTLHRSIGAKLDLRQVAGILVGRLTPIVDCEGCAERTGRNRVCVDSGDMIA